MRERDAHGYGNTHFAERCRDSSGPSEGFDAGVVRGENVDIVRSDNHAGLRITVDIGLDAATDLVVRVHARASDADTHFTRSQRHGTGKDDGVDGLFTGCFDSQITSCINA